MKEHIGNKLLHRFWRIENKFVRFLLVGILNTVFGYLMYLFFIWIGLHYALALFCGLVVGVFFNFHTIGGLVFQTKNYRMIWVFYLVYLGVYLINVGELYLLRQSGIYDVILGLPYLEFIHDMPINLAKAGDSIGQAMVLVPNSLLSFFFNRKLVFSRVNENKERI